MKRSGLKRPFGEVTCHKCGHKGHIAPNCTNVSASAVSSVVVLPAVAAAVPAIAGSVTASSQPISAAVTTAAPPELPPANYGFVSNFKFYHAHWRVWPACVT
jgi:hypothetical protein